MANHEELIVSGFQFGSVDDAKAAAKEMKNAQYIDERVNSMNVKQLIAVYDKMINDKVFNTPIGWEYLRYLRERIIQEGGDEHELRPIPLYVTLTSSKDASKDDHAVLDKLKFKPSKSDYNIVTEKLHRSVVFNVILVIMVILMFIITLISPSPNIINYKTTIANQYSQWEQELTQREQVIREKEAQLENSGG